MRTSSAMRPALVPKLGAPLVVLGAPLVIDSDAVKPAGNDLEAILREIVTRIRG